MFRSVPVQTRCSIVSYEVQVYSGVKRIDYNVNLTKWKNCFGVSNRLNFPIRTHTRNVSFATNFGKVTVGIDEAEDESAWPTEPGWPWGTGPMDGWLTSPGPTTPAFERGWQMGPREVLDWFQAEGEAASVMLGSSVGLFDWTDRAELYGPNAVVLAPELLVHTRGNQGLFTNETGDHQFFFSLFATKPGWQHGWQPAVGSRTPLTTVWKKPTYQHVNRGLRAELGTGLLSQERTAFLTVEPSNLWVTTVKRETPMQAGWQECPPEHSFRCAPKKNGVIVRLFDNIGLDTMAELCTPTSVSGNASHLVDMLELQPQAALAVQNNSKGSCVHVAVGHHAIQTVWLDMGIH
eukprot:SAG31_NODE_702_length_12723_cov_4.100206_4_plen_349_part_00